MKKKLIAFIAAVLSLTICCSAFSAAAVEDAEIQTNHDSAFRVENQLETLRTVDVTDLPDSSELEEMYINKLFYGGGISTYADYGRDKLTGLELQIYNDLRAEIEKIARGDKTSTKCVTSVKREVAIGDYETSNQLFDAARVAVKYLMVDLPEDFYWFDKTSGWALGTDGPSLITSPTYTITLTATFDVSTDYRGADSTTVDPQKIKAAQTAVKKAQAIAAKYDGQSAYNKILGYKKEICDLVSYNTSVVGSHPSVVGINPWQLVWVFDGDPSTNVVCEGYSKAFQYLCDLGGVECYTVTGTMNGGGHMWNVVVLGGKSYLVDITNCDENSIGAPDKLLLKGATQSNGVSCVFSNLRNLTYVYDTDTDIYSSDILKVSTSDYDPSQTGTVLGDVNGDGKINNTDIIMLGRAYMSGDGAKYLSVADMNGDGQINNADIIMLGRLYMSSVN